MSHASPVVPQSPEFMGEDPDESESGAELCKCGVEATNTRGHSLQRFPTNAGSLMSIVILSLSSRGRHGTGEGGEGPHLYRSHHTLDS